MKNEGSGNKPTPAQVNFLREVLLHLRQYSGLTQAEAAHKARLSDSKLSLYENGLVELTKVELNRLYRILSKDSPPINFRELTSGDAAKKDTIKKWEEWRTKGRARQDKESRRFARKQVGMTQNQLARETGIPANKIIQWELGRVELTSEEQDRWKQVLRNAEKKQKQADPWWKLQVAHYTIEDLIEEKKGVVARLENLQGINDPVIAEIIESYQREIAALEKQLSGKASMAVTEESAG